MFYQRSTFSNISVWVQVQDEANFETRHEKCEQSPYILFYNSFRRIKKKIAGNTTDVHYVKLYVSTDYLYS